MTRRLIWALAGAGAGVAFHALQMYLQAFPMLPHLEVRAAAFVVVAVVLGGWGLGGAVAGRLAVLAATGSLATSPLLILAGTAAGAALVRLVLRRSRSFVLDLRTPRATLLYAATTFVFALVYAPVWSWAVLPEAFLGSVLILLPLAVASLLVLVPPALMAATRLPAGWIAWPTEGADAAAPSAPLLDARSRSAVEANRFRLAEVRLVPTLVVSTLCIGVVALSLTSGSPAPWLLVLYLLPLYWASHRHHLPGALLTASYLSLGHLVAVVLFAEPGSVVAGHAQAVDVAGALLLVWVVAAFMGSAELREWRLLERLELSNEMLRQDLARSVSALTGAVEARDAYTEGHLDRVHAYATEVGKRLGLRGEDLEMVRIAATLHDIGKIGIPDHILHKPGPLDGEERAIMQRHPEIGARLLGNVNGLEGAAALVRHHQERYDGQRDGRFPGYPAGLAGEEIPLGARIIAVVDAYDAMTTDRPYRLGTTGGQALAELRRESGRQFDPRVVAAFAEVLTSRPWAGEATGQDKG